MDGADYRAQDAIGLAALIEAGEVTPRALLERALAEVSFRDGVVGSVVHKFPELAEACIADGLPAGPFRGVPLVLKDAGLSMMGTPLTSGSRLFDGAICQTDDTLARRLKAAGFVPFGRTKTPEFSLSFTTEPEAFGPTRNPWAPGRSAGGSSGGAAAAVASGIVPVAHASDGAGSIRVPAAHCGVFGFKPTRIRNPLGPRVAEGNAGMATAHAITRSVRDSAALLDATSGPDIGDPYAVEAPQNPFLQSLEADPRPLVIGWITRGVDAVDSHCQAAVADAAELCADLGHRVEEAEWPFASERLGRAWRAIAGVGLAVMVGAHGDRLTRDLVEPVDLEWIEEGRRCLGVDYLAAVNDLHMAARALGQFFTRFDVMLSPVTAAVAPLLGKLAGRGRSLDRFFADFWAHAPFTAIFNASGCPAMSVPLYWTPALPDALRGLPVGVQFGAAYGSDSLLFALAGQLERARPWSGRRPQCIGDVQQFSQANERVVSWRPSMK